MEINPTPEKTYKDLSHYLRTYKFPIIGSLGTLLVLVIFGFATQQSLPGEMLYTVKTGVFEDITQSAQFSVKKKAAYQITKMETRLGEVKKLAKKENVSERAIQDAITQTTNHTKELHALIATSIDSAFSKTDVLYTLNEFASVAGAIEAVAENDKELIELGNSIENNRQDIVGTYKDRVGSFVQTESPQTVLEYVTAQLNSVKEALGDENLSDRTTAVINNNLETLSNAISKNNLTRIITATGEAQRTLKIEKYSGIITPLVVENNEQNASTTQTTGTSTQVQGTSTITQ